jgi:hypothetical protein
MLERQEIIRKGRGRIGTEASAAEKDRLFAGPFPNQTTEGA